MHLCSTNRLSCCRGTVFTGSCFLTALSSSSIVHPAGFQSAKRWKEAVTRIVYERQLSLHIWAGLAWKKNSIKALIESGMRHSYTQNETCPSCPTPEQSTVADAGGKPDACISSEVLPLAEHCSHGNSVQGGCRLISLEFVKRKVIFCL